MSPAYPEDPCTETNSLTFGKLEVLDIYNESTIAFKDIPKWCKENIGIRIDPSTATRWRLKGVKGVKLDSVYFGGSRITTVEELMRFIEAINTPDEKADSVKGKWTVVSFEDNSNDWDFD